nr:hypothetical protein DVH24_016143 [Ipomoea trifida]
MILHRQRMAGWGLDQLILRWHHQSFPARSTSSSGVMEKNGSLSRLSFIDGIGDSSFVCSECRNREELQFLAASYGDTDALDGLEKRRHHFTVVSRPGEFFLVINLNVADAGFLKAVAELLAHSGRDLGVPQVMGPGEAVQLGSVMSRKLLLRR